MKRLLNIFVSSIGAGLLISIGGFVYLALKDVNQYLGAFLFSIGLLVIISFGLYLYTGKVGYIFDNKKNFLLDLLVCYFGNLCGAVSSGYILRLVRNNYFEVAEKVVKMKIDDNIGSILILSVFCGMLIYLAVDIQKREVSNIVKTLGIILPVMVFILSGFEHCVANMFYISYANYWSLKAVLYIVIMSLGNGVGSLIIWGIMRLSKKINQ